MHYQRVMQWWCVVGLALTCAWPALAEEGQPLRITQQSHEFVVQTLNGPVVITRSKTACGAPLGFVQALVPLQGVTPVNEIDVLHALNDLATMVIDMRDEDEPLDAALPNSYHVPYNELEDRMAALGCTRNGKNPWNCASAFKIVAFDWGPMCVQAPTGIANLVKMGFPVSKIFYYRGGMLDWEGLGLTTVTGNRPLASRPVSP